MPRSLLVVIVIFLAVIAGAAGGIYLWQKSKNREVPYVAVYLDTGDIYFGQLSYFPRLSLKDAYHLQSVPDPNNPVGGSSLQIVPLRTSIWAPERLLLNPDKVVLVAKIGKDSQVMRVIRQSKQ
jgi:hypothetical protein